jgi:hypothetical protein
MKRALAVRGLSPTLANREEETIIYPLSNLTTAYGEKEHHQQLID